MPGFRIRPSLGIVEPSVGCSSFRNVLLLQVKTWNRGLRFLSAGQLTMPFQHDLVDLWQLARLQEHDPQA